MAVKVVANGGGGAVGPQGETGEQGPAGTGAGSGTTLDGATVIGATSIVVAEVPADLLVGTPVAIDAGTNKCEIRIVTAIVGATLTLKTATKVAHNDGVNVWVASDFWLPPEWWGAVAGDSTIDSYRSLINMFLDQDQWGVRGRAVGSSNGDYYSSRPLFFPDKANVHIALTAFDPFGFDCSEAEGHWNGIPNQYFLNTAGQKVTATFDSAANEVTFSSSVGEFMSDVVFYPRPGSTMPGGIVEGKRYFTMDSTLTTRLEKSQLMGATEGEVDITSNGSGEIVAISGGLCRIQDGKVSIAGNKTKGLNGLFHLTQQPSSVEIRIEDFPVVGATIGGQQGYMENLVVINCHIGLEVVGLANYFSHGNSELNDINVVIADDDRWPNGSGSNKGIVFGDFHFESPGGATAQIQQFTPSGTLTSGQFKFQFKAEKTAFIDFDATAAEIEAALEALSSVGAGNVEVTQLTGTNLSDGAVKLDFTVGDLKWERWISSTNPRFGGLSDVTDSTLVGGTLTRKSLHPDARNISFRAGRGVRFTGCLYGNVGTPIGGSAGPAFIHCEGSALSIGTNQGFKLEDISIITQTAQLVNDSLHGIVTTGADESATGVAEYCESYTRPGRHGGQRGHHYWWMGEGGRRIKQNTRGEAMLELQASATQGADNLVSYKNSSGTVGFGVDKDGTPMILAGSETKDWGSVADGAQLSEAVTVTGAALGDFAMASMSVAVPAGVSLTANVTATNVVTVTITNHSGAPVDLASGTLRATVIQPTV